MILSFDRSSSSSIRISCESSKRKTLLRDCRSKKFLVISSIVSSSSYRDSIPVVRTDEADVLSPSIHSTSVFWVPRAKFCKEISSARSSRERLAYYWVVDLRRSKWNHLEDTILCKLSYASLILVQRLPYGWYRSSNIPYHQQPWWVSWESRKRSHHRC